MSAERDLIASLNRNQRAHLAIVLSKSHGVDRLRQELGIHRNHVMDEGDVATGAARRGRTQDLDWPVEVRRLMKHQPVNLNDVEL